MCYRTHDDLEADGAMLAGEPDRAEDEFGGSEEPGEMFESIGSIVSRMLMRGWRDE